MRIVQYMQGFRHADGGVVRALIDLANALAQRGHAVDVLTLDASDAPAAWDGGAGRPRLHRLPTSRLPGPFAGRLSEAGLRTALGCIANADLLHLHVPWDPVCLRLAAAARKMHKP